MYVVDDIPTPIQIQPNARKQIFGPSLWKPNKMNLWTLRSPNDGLFGSANQMKLLFPMKNGRKQKRILLYTLAKYEPNITVRINEYKLRE